VKVAKKMARQELGLPENEVRFGMHLTGDGISLTHRGFPGIVIDYTWHEVEMEMKFSGGLND